jgi:hypothetical protein
VSRMDSGEVAWFLRCRVSPYPSCINLHLQIATDLNKPFTTGASSPVNGLEPRIEWVRGMQKLLVTSVVFENHRQFRQAIQ